MTNRILVTGASIAGPTVAWWLARAGFDVTVVERAPAFREGGQSIDIRGAARTVIARMGLEEIIRDHLTGERGIAFVRADNSEVVRFDADGFQGNGPTAEFEILRGELGKILVDAGRDRIRYIFGDRIRTLEQDGNGVRVGFENGTDGTFDCVIVAEGIGSATRRLVFGDAVKRRPFNLYTSYFTIPKGGTDSAIARIYSAPGGRGLAVRPDNMGTTRAALSFLSTPDGLERQSTDVQKRVLRERFADAGWETDRILDGMDSADDFYLESVGQVRMDGWSKGRVVLVGDAAYCASPLSGMGTALSLVGAYVLAGELARAGNPAEAFANYERLVRPYVAKAQNIPTFAPRFGQPRTRWGIAVQRTVLKFLSLRPVSAIGAKFLLPPADAIDLPDYAFQGEPAAGMDIDKKEDAISRA